MATLHRGEGAPTYNFAQISEKLHEIKKILVRGGGDALDPPLGLQPQMQGGADQLFIKTIPKNCLKFNPLVDRRGAWDMRSPARFKFFVFMHVWFSAKIL